MNTSISSDEVVLSARGVCKSYGDLEVLKGIDLNVHRGETAVIVGPSGSGKSTFLRCINRLETIESGLISVDGDVMGFRRNGHELHELREREVAAQRSKIGMVFQQFNLFGHLTALENIIEGPCRVRVMPASEATRRALRLLDQMGLSDKANAYPSELSGGQQQRVAIARAMAMDPVLMLFDEPTSALDPELVGEVLDVMRNLVLGGITMIIVTHEISFAREVGDTLIVMDEGRIIEMGSPDDVLSRPKTQRSADFFSHIK